MSMCLLIAVVAQAQTQDVTRYHDTGLWMGVGVKKKVSKKLSFAADTEYRLDSSISHATTRFAELSGTYKFSKDLSITPFYRFAQKHKSNTTWDGRQRLGVDIDYEKKIKPFNFSVRERIYMQFNNGISADWRTKLGVEYLGISKKITPYVNTEIFLPFGGKASTVFDKMRYQIGVGYDISKASKVKLGLMHQRTFGMWEKATGLPVNFVDDVITLGYSFSF